MCCIGSEFFVIEIVAEPFYCKYRYYDAEKKGKLREVSLF